MSRRPRRRPVVKRSDDPFDRFITERSRGADGEFSFQKMVELFTALGVPEFIPRHGSHGTRRMTAGNLLREYYSDGVLHFLDGTRVTLDLEPTQ